MNVAAPLDHARARALRALGPVGAPLLRDRELRVAVYAAIAVAAAFAMVAAAPLEVLAIGPVVLGVPHLVADLRYLVAKRDLHRRLAFWMLVVVPSCACWFWPSASLAFLALGGGALAARASARVRIPIAIGAVVCAALASGPLATVVFAHVHNVIALVALFALSKRGARGPAIAAVLAVVGSALFLSGALDDLAFRSFARGMTSPDTAVQTLAPDLPVVLATRVVVVFAFMQSIHYGVWVRLVPEVDREKPGLRPFAASVRALRADLGLPVLVLVAIASALFLFWSLRSIEAARLGYLRLALFHGPLELGALMILGLEGKLRR